MTAAADKFAREVDEVRWQLALSIAFLFLRSDNRFIGLDKMRKPIAEAAAMSALGWPTVPTFLTKKDMAGTEADIMCRELLATTIDHIKSKMGQEQAA